MAQSAWHRVHGTGSARCCMAVCGSAVPAAQEKPGGNTMQPPPAPPGSLARPGITDCCFLAARQGQAMPWGASRWLELSQQPGAQRG